MRISPFNLASRLSLVLLIVTCFTWARSLYAYDVAVFTTTGHRYERTTMWTLMGGQIWFTRVTSGSQPDEVESSKMLLSDAGGDPYMGLPRRQPRNILGFAFGSEPSKTVNSRITWYLAVPFWFVAALLSILPTMRFIRRGHEHRRLLVLAHGYCPGCAADLRACFDATCPSCSTERWKSAT